MLRRREERPETWGAVEGLHPEVGCRVAPVAPGHAAGEDGVEGLEGLEWLERREMMAGIFPQAPALRRTPDASPGWTEEGGRRPW